MTMTSWPISLESVRILKAKLGISRCCLIRTKCLIEVFECWLWETGMLGLHAPNEGVKAVAQTSRGGWDWCKSD